MSKTNIFGTQLVLFTKFLGTKGRYLFQGLQPFLLCYIGTAAETSFDAAGERAAFQDEERESRLSVAEKPR